MAYKGHSTSHSLSHQQESPQKTGTNKNPRTQKNSQTKTTHNTTKKNKQHTKTRFPPTASGRIFRAESQALRPRLDSTGLGSAPGPSTTAPAPGAPRLGPGPAAAPRADRADGSGGERLGASHRVVGWAGRNQSGQGRFVFFPGCCFFGQERPKKPEKRVEPLGWPTTRSKDSCLFAEWSKLRVYLFKMVTVRKTETALKE